MGLNIIRFLLEPDYRAIKSWKIAQGDRRLLLDFHFAPGDLVLEGGCYRGDYTGRIAACGQPTVIGYEPVEAFCAAARRATAHQPRVEIRCAGLSNRDGISEVALCGEGTSSHRSGAPETATILLERAADVIRRLDRDVALLALNVEGEEYAILEDLLHEKLMERIGCLLVQFHRITPDSDAHHSAIAAKLGKTHGMRWRYPFVWERWDRR